MTPELYAFKPWRATQLLAMNRIHTNHHSAQSAKCKVQSAPASGFPPRSRSSTLARRASAPARSSPEWLSPRVRVLMLRYFR